MPVLVGGATLPPENELPRDIRDIILRQAGVLGDASRDDDLHKFYSVPDPLLGVAPRPLNLLQSPPGSFAVQGSVDTCIRCAQGP